MRIYILFMFCLALGFSLRGQDIHYSQFYNMPLLQNPALTGHLEGKYRVQGIYRNQWFSITNGGVYSTPGFSADMNIKFKEDASNSIGAGLMVMNDRTGGGTFNSTWVLASVAYHLAMSKKEKSYFSIGVQGGVLMRRIDNSSMIFADQLSPVTGNPITGTAENFANTNTSGSDLRLGLAYSGYSSSKMNYKIGLAYMHILQPEEVFLEGTEENKLPGRLSVFGQASITMKNAKVRLLPELLFMNQSGVNEINFVSNVGYRIQPAFELVVGAGYRVFDAVPFNLGANFNGFKVMLTYDINISQLTPASSSVGAVEVSLGYVGSFKKPMRPNLPCIRLF